MDEVIRTNRVLERMRVLRHKYLNSSDEQEYDATVLGEAIALIEDQREALDRIKDQSHGG